MPLVITALTASALAFLLVALAILTIRQRLRHRAPFGDAGQQPLTAAIRAHANLAEYMPIGITLIALIEGGRHDPMLLGAAAAAFVMARLLNAVGLYAPPGPPGPARSIGIVATLTILLGLALWLAARTLGQL